MADWCWYKPGASCFLSGFASRQDAINHAFTEEPRSLVAIGTATPILDAAVGCVEADILADNIVENLEVEDLEYTLNDGAQEALEEWVRKYVDFGMTEVCLDGTDPTPEEWEAARLASEKAGES